MKQLRVGLSSAAVVVALIMQPIEAQQKPPPPKLIVPQLESADVAVTCVDCPVPFDTTTHKEVLKKLAGNPYVAQFRYALYEQDILHQFESKAHFDNCDFDESINYIDSLLGEVDGHVGDAMFANANADMPSRHKAVLRAFYGLGQALHVIQDFYAHTNYVELQSPTVRKVTDIEIIAMWRPTGRKRVLALRAEGLVSGFVWWGFPKKCASGTASHADLAKDSADTKNGKKRIAHLQNISQYRVARFLAREASLALMRDAYKRWPILQKVNGSHIAFETIVDRRGP